VKRREITKIPLSVYFAQGMPYAGIAEETRISEDTKIVLALVRTGVFTSAHGVIVALGDVKGVQSPRIQYMMLPGKLLLRLFTAPIRLTNV
jgi:hypothetical protein